EAVEKGTHAQLDLLDGGEVDAAVVDLRPLVLPVVGDDVDLPGGVGAVADARQTLLGVERLFDGAGVVVVRPRVGPRADLDVRELDAARLLVSDGDLPRAV